MNLIERIRNALRKRYSLRELGWPSLEDLQSIGLSGAEFYDRYITGWCVSAWSSPQAFSRHVLSRLYADYPELIERRSKPPDDRDQIAPGTP